MKRLNKKGRGVIFWGFILALLGAIIYFGIKYYFVISILLGNDIAIRLSSSNENIFLTGGESEEISFSTSILASPFCSANCTSKFIDLSEDKIISSENFTLKTAIPETRSYDIKNLKNGNGQDYYRFEVKCIGVGKFLCPTESTEKSKSTLVTVNYGLNKEDEATFDEYKNSLYGLIENTSILNQRINSLVFIVNSANKLEIPSVNNLPLIQNNVQTINKTLFEAKKSLENFNLADAEGKIKDSKTKLELAEIEYSKLNNTIYSNVSSYNGFIDILENLKNELEGLKQINVDVESASQIDDLIIEYNDAIAKFNLKSSLIIKQTKINEVFNELSSYNATTNSSGVKASESISSVPKKINLTENLIPDIKIELKEMERECCLFGNCSVCCKNCAEKNYPVILLHGHAFNRIVSAEYSLEDFQKIQEKLEADGFLNAGALLISPQEEQKDIWGEINYPITLRASYYFDIYKNPGENSVIQTKSDNLDSYALRLKEVVDSAKYKTGKDKVIIVAHSMGGLVTRKYMQIFGSENIDKLIMIGTPNQGIKNNILTFCSTLGESLECRDMDQNSLFLNKLNYAEKPKIPVYNLIGTGCSMNGEDGDGIVTNQSAYLDGAQNFYFNGKCEESSIIFFHTKLLDPYEYPEVYNKLKEILKG